MIDLHSHILRGIDDGARTLEDSLEIARAAVSDGITVIAGTPHVRDDWPTDAGVMEHRVAELRAELQLAGIPLDVRAGGEIAIEWLARLSVEELRRFGLGGNPRYLLVETPYYGWPLGLEDALFSLRASGIRPVLAHPERNAEVQAQPERLVSLVQSGALVQVTAASVDGRIGRRAGGRDGRSGGGRRRRAARRVADPGGAGGDRRRHADPAAPRRRPVGKRLARQAVRRVTSPCNSLLLARPSA